MQKKEMALYKMAKVIVLASSVIGIFTIWGICYYMLIIAAENKSQVPTSQVVFTQSACAKLAGNKLAAGDCYMKVAKTRKNEAICERIEIVELRDFCYVELAEIKNSYVICQDKVVTPSIKGVCDEYFGTIGSQAGSGSETPGDSDTVAWKTYQSDYGYRFDYPGDWKITVMDSDPSTAADNDLNKKIGIVQSVMLNNDVVQGSVFSLEVMNNTIDNAIAVDEALYGSKTGRPVTIGGMTGERLDGAFYGMQYVVRDGLTYFFLQGNAVSEADEKDFDKVMESFEFIRE